MSFKINSKRLGIGCNSGAALETHPQSGQAQHSSFGVFVCILSAFVTPLRWSEPKRYLVVGGPYRFTRNPIYLCGMLIWLGWIIFYGSVSVLAGTVVIWGSVAMLVVPRAERNLEARFAEAYLRYKQSVPRW